MGWMLGRIAVMACALAAAPVCPGTANAASSKRGVAAARFLATDPGALTRLGAHWAYDWSARVPNRRLPLAWVPMVWGAASVTSSTIAELRRERASGRARELLGFNEPDSHTQSNMSPQLAASLWPRLESTGLRLGSPAPAVPGDGWLDAFMAIAAHRHLRVDFIALHAYQDFTDPNAVADLRRELTAIHAKYHRPLWVTEIGTVDIRIWGRRMLHTPTKAMARSYMKRVLPMLNALPFVQRYAWFTDNCWNHAECRLSTLLTPTRRPTSTASTFVHAKG
jgi:hypothetical protein